MGGHIGPQSVRHRCGLCGRNGNEKSGGKGGAGGSTASPPDTGRIRGQQRAVFPPEMKRGLAEPEQLTGVFANFAFMIYLLFMHNNIDPPLGGLVNAILLPKLQSESIIRE